MPLALIVDDHASFRRVARRLMDAAGFEAAEAATGAAALAASGAARYDLVLLDVQLPDLDGFDVARRLAAAECPPPVVLTSLRPARDYGRRVSLCPVLGFVPKPDLSVSVLRSMLAGTA